MTRDKQDGHAETEARSRPLRVSRAGRDDEGADQALKLTDGLTTTSTDSQQPQLTPSGPPPSVSATCISSATSQPHPSSSSTDRAHNLRPSPSCSPLPTPFPAAMASVKVASLLIKTISKPIANKLKQQAQEHPSFRKITIALAQQMHRSEARLRTGFLGEPKTAIRPLVESKGMSLVTMPSSLQARAEGKRPDASVCCSSSSSPNPAPPSLVQL